MSATLQNNRIKVLVPKIGLFPLDYELSDGSLAKVGDLVIVPFRGKNITAIVWEINCSKIHVKGLKTIDLKIQESINIGVANIELIKKTSDYYLCSLGSVAKLVLPVDINEPPIKHESEIISEDNLLLPLSGDQKLALEFIDKAIKPVLLKGVTGSGKTEVFFHKVSEIIAQGKQALIMLPEISLSSQIIDRFNNRFGFEPTVWNSKITKAKKKKILRGIINGKIKLVIGARSSLFLPYKDLGLIVVDEEHDASYKQGEGVLYNARDMAVLKSCLVMAKVILVSATPSIETIYNVKQGKYQMVELKNRFSNATMPLVEIIDMKNCNSKQNNWLSNTLVDAIKKTINEKKQVLLFLNRRGYAPLMLCRSCGYRFSCNNCSASMVIHKNKKRMECHHCGAVSKIYDICPECKKSDSLILCGPGVDRIAEYAREIFPNLRIKIASKDQATNQSHMDEIMKQMEHGDVDILIGTQIIAKGYHFPNLALVGVVDADLGFVGGDLRSAEKTFQLLHQVGGRAGRDIKTKGRVLLQTYFPDNKVLQALVLNDEVGFVKQEMLMRKEALMPPFSKMASINITGKYKERTLLVAKDIANKAPKAPNSSARILGPAESMMFKLAGRYRYKILIIADKKFNIQKYISVWLNSISLSSAFQIKIDIDPYSFY